MLGVVSVRIWCRMWTSFFAAAYKLGVQVRRSRTRCRMSTMPGAVSVLLPSAFSWLRRSVYGGRFACLRGRLCEHLLLVPSSNSKKLSSERCDDETL